MASAPSRAFFSSGRRPESLCVLVTGISGAGRSQAIKCLEDFGFFCVDNLPAPLLPQFADLIVKQGTYLRRVALGVDIREGKFLRSLADVLKEFHSRGIRTWVLFFDASDAALLRRFSETRRRHPLGPNVLKGIREERRLLRDVRTRADRLIETSGFTLSDLKEKIAASLPLRLDRALHVTIYSFGFKYGIPPDADIVWDVRFLPNPFYVPSLKARTGLEAPVRRYVFKNALARGFLRDFFAMVKRCLPFYLKEGKSHLTLAIGCTGGKHRSVTIAEALAQFLKRRGYPVVVEHRDLEDASA